jgi:general secretion pathway protein K
MIVMMVIVVLGLLAAGLSYSMKVETQLARNFDAEGEVLWLARSGLELAGWYIAQKDLDPQQIRFDCLAQEWAGGPGLNADIEPLVATHPVTGLSLQGSALGRGEFSIEIVDQERRFNINRATPEIMEKALDMLGLATLDTDVVLDSLEDWKDPNDVPLINGAESEYYLNQAPPDGPHFAKDGPIEDLAELLMVRGLGRELVFGGVSPEVGEIDAPIRRLGFVGGWKTEPGGVCLADLFNTSGDARININTASKEVLELLPGMDSNLAEGIVMARQGLDGRDGTEDDTPYQDVRDLGAVGGIPPQYIGILARLCTVRSSTFEVRVRASVGNYERVYVAIITRPVARRGMVVMRSWWE